MKKTIQLTFALCTMACLTIPSFSLAQKTIQSWDLPGIDIISRAERGADEYIRIWEDTGQENTYTKDEKTKTAETYLLKNYPDDFLIENTVNKNGDDYLTWGLQYNNKKKAIVIHHTVSNTSEVEEE
jgi:hypothetical protein